MDPRSQLLNAEPGYEAVSFPNSLFPMLRAERMASKMQCIQGSQGEMLECRVQVQS